MVWCDVCMSYVCMCVCDVHACVMCMHVMCVRIAMHVCNAFFNVMWCFVAHWDVMWCHACNVCHVCHVCDVCDVCNVYMYVRMYALHVRVYVCVHVM